MRSITRARLQSGTALVLVLVLITAIVAPLLGFLLFMEFETRKADKVVGFAESRVLSEFALQEAMAKLMEGSRAAGGAPGDRTASMTAGPGLMEVLRYDVPYFRGDEKGAAAFTMPDTKRPFFTDPFAREYGGKPANPRWIPLYSRKWFAPGTRYLRVEDDAGSEENPDYNPAALFNINTPDNPFRPGEFYLSGLPAEPAFPRREKDDQGNFPNTGNEAAFAFRAGEPVCDRPVFVQWIPVLQDPTQPPGPENPMVGRYAYWIDVENTKVNLNRADRQWRKQPAFGLVGDADAVSLGSGSYFEQSSTNPAIVTRRIVEGALPGRENQTIDGQTRRPTPTFVGASLRSLWLDWLDGNPPAAADNSVVDWDYFESVQAGAGDEEVIPFGDLAETNASEILQGKRAPLHQVEELFSMLNPAIEQSGKGRRVEGAFQRVVASSATTFGYEDERDPLGRPKIDLVRFLKDNQNAAGSGGNPNLLKSTELWRRLSDSKYHRVYDPGLKAADGKPKSFIQSLNRFAGTGSVSNANGEAAVLQMLVNMIEYTLPPERPPLISTSTGIVGMRSIPYVAEVCTRAKSALWLLPEADRNDPTKLLATDPVSGKFTYTYNGKGLEYYATNVIIDVAVACVNPDPFADRIFDGTITLQYTWKTPVPATWAVQQGPQSKPLKGSFAAVAEAGEEAKSIDVSGDAVVFNLGVVPGSTLSGSRDALRITGWEIRDSSGNLWHKVPVKHPGATTTKPWYNLARDGNPVGAFDSYLKDENGGFLATIPYVGWFTIPRRKSDVSGSHLKNRLEMMWWEGKFDGTAVEPQLTRMKNFIGGLSRRAVFETVRCLDPAMGHRTGHPVIQSEIPIESTPDQSDTYKGHVFGATGHPWRHAGSVGVEQAESDPDFLETNKSVAISELPKRTTTVSVDETNLSVATRQASGIGWSNSTVSIPLRRAVETAQSTVNAPLAACEPEGLLRWFGFLDQDVFPLDRADFKIKDDGKWLEEIVASEVKTFKPGKDSDIETLALAGEMEVKAFKTDEIRGKQVKGFFCGAPRGKMMVSVGEIGFVHSGIPNFPILVGGAPGWNEYQLNCPRNGPPMRMLLDLFTPGAFVDPDTGRRRSEGEWASGSVPSNRPSAPRIGTWNVNTAIAHEGYMTIREGSTGLTEEMKKEFNPSSLPARVIWHPAAGGWRRNSYGNEHEFSKKLSEAHRKFPGEPIDRLALPFTAMPRGSQAWIAAIGGDFSPSRAVGGGAWSYFNPGYNTFASGQFTWCAGRGVAASAPYYQTAFAEAGPGESLHSRLLTFGSDGRKAYEVSDDPSKTPKLNENDGYLRGRFTADEWLDFQNVQNHKAYLPRTASPRFSVFPMRHFVSDLGLDYNFGAEMRLFKTALNPRTTAFPSVTTDEDGEEKIDDKLSDHNHFPGGHHASGLFLHAPHVLFANQVSTSANAFTIHVVAQTIRDEGLERAGIQKSGKGYSDPDDRVASEVWSRTIVVRDKPKNDNDTEVRFRVVSADSR